MTGPTIPRIDQSTLRDTVYRALRDAFTRGQFAAGDVLNLRNLAEQLGTSLTPVREAVRRLVAEGALIDTPSRTLAVPPFDLARMHDLKRGRLALESLVVEMAFERMDSSALDQLEACLDGSDGPDLERNYAFHFTLYRQSGSPVLLPLVEALWLQYGPYLNLIIQEDNARAMAQDTHHAEILSALRRRDLAAAQSALQADIERSFAILAHKPQLQAGSGAA